MFFFRPDVFDSVRGLPFWADVPLDFLTALAAVGGTDFLTALAAVGWRRAALRREGGVAAT